MIRILVVDDHPVVREGLAAVLADEPDFKIVGEASSGERALEEATRLRPDVILLDVRLPGMSGIETCGRLVESKLPSRMVILTSFPNEGAMMSSFAAGAHGFVLKESESATLRQAVRTVAQGETYADPRVAAKLIALASKGNKAKGPFGLTIQEMRILECLPRGLTNREIGVELGLSVHTVKTHVRNALQKLNARDRAEAASIALKEGLA